MSEEHFSEVTSEHTSCQLGFGGSCHWCTEAIFQAIRGVSDVKQGWIASTGKYAAFSEAVLVTYDPRKISLENLIDIHLATHSSTSNHRLREKYRSAVYCCNEKDEDLVLKILARKSPGIVTKALFLETFRLNDEKYLNYFKRMPDAPFCDTYITPKIKNLSFQFRSFLKSSE